VIIARSAIIRYIFFGVVFGFCFPIAALLFDVVFHNNLPFNLQSIFYVHKENPIHYIIDSAPLVLGIAFGIAGIYLQRARLLNLSLSRQANNLANANAKLTKALDEIQVTQNRLVNSEKLASLGQLTAGIAHELRNPLNFINNFSESGSEIINDLLEDDDAPGLSEIVNDLRSNFQKINEHGKRANNILESIMLVARTGNGEKKLMNLNSLCNDAGNIAYRGMSSSVIGFKCDFRIDLTPELPQINVVKEDFTRVIINLLTNSFYAVNKKRILEDSSYKPMVILSTTFKKDVSENNDEIILKIHDNGTGIPSDSLKQVFNPFFTTKPCGEGTGLGLSISQDIISAHNGHMSVVSQENILTEFTISLPVK
jgi:two-component system NtrC family sensor kinase